MSRYSTSARSIYQLAQFNTLLLWIIQWPWLNSIIVLSTIFWRFYSGLTGKNNGQKNLVEFSGHVKAYAGSTETQGTGQLHFHCLVWIHGVPSTLTEVESILSDEVRGPQFSKQVIDYTTAVVSHLLPISEQIDCIKCGAAHPLSYNSVPIPESAKMTPPKYGPKYPPIIATCRMCGHNITADTANMVMLRKADREIRSKTISTSEYNQNDVSQFIFHPWSLNSE